MLPVRATGWLSITEFLNEQQKEALLYAGYVPVNDALYDLWKRDFDICLLFGSRGGGKSAGLADDLIDQCMTETYFKGMYGRKVFENVRGSQFAELVACIKKNKLESEFHFSERENSSMIITHIATGNHFIPFGSDKADKLKSVKDPSVLWLEEFDQFTFEDFSALYPVLRTTRASTRFYGTFNSYAITLRHWIIKIFFPDLYQGDDNYDPTLFTSKRVKKFFINYEDNHFIDREAYRQNLWISAGFNRSLFEGIANGAWGVQINDSPYAFAFNRERHMGSCILNRAHPVILGFDFNRNPMSCTVAQLYNNHLYVIETIKLPHSGVEGMCTYIKTHYPGCLYLATGDYNGNNVSSLFAEQVTHYKLIKQFLNLTDGQLKVRPNPKQALNSTHINNILAHFPVTIDHKKAWALIFDLENVKRRADGTILKEDRDKPDQQGDILDCFRYICNSFLDWFDPIKYADKVIGKALAPPPPEINTSALSVLRAIETGSPATCTKVEYHLTVRVAILQQAEKWLTMEESVKVQNAILELKRLDRLFA